MSADAAPGGASHAAPLHPGCVTLRVRDLGRVADYYARSIGLEEQSRDGSEARFGAGGATFLRLEADPKAPPPPPGAAGLFHVAYLLPSRPALGAWLMRASRNGAELEGASDHSVSEALYLSDPEGNGIEVYCDRPRAAWAWEEGMVVMGTRRLDLQALTRDATGPQETIPAGTRIGHVHLCVGDIAQAEGFWSGVVGFDVVRRMPQASFLSTGRYHHHLATNTWRSAGAARRDPASAGLVSVEMVADDPAVLNAAGARMLAAGGQRQGAGYAAEDPWGNRVVLTTPA